MEECGAALIEDPAAMKGRWHEAFGRTSPIMLEIGSGKGRFICDTALSRPGDLFIAVGEQVDRPGVADKDGPGGDGDQG